ncbi:hypothetical protein [Brevundimonas sp. TSRC1-1]|uniref:hypothetical protein n=1 Tax=Brevundimonas sp. TSRC1-1 TaxID=2804562 RepID=UPI003CF64B10
MANFEPVSITGMNVNASHASGQGALKNIVLTLSGRPPYGWNDMFNGLWARHFYMMKRRAEVAGGQMTVTCMEDELEGGLLEELKKVVSEANQHFVAAQQEAENKRQQEAARGLEERQKLEGLANRLKFD